MWYLLGQKNKIYRRPKVGNYRGNKKKEMKGEKEGNVSVD